LAASALGLTSSAVTELADRLEHAGLASRHEDEELEKLAAFLLELRDVLIANRTDSRIDRDCPSVKAG
jgi:DNA-binding MarR family transcriptional regulator